ncbi:MAG: prepilin-type N-terminal cleavage/methylation domain-containing protein [Candidatus Omnitrophica bacterium]|nr:prepilin-type N-terminal cleavage/methylation domain-containing protein [Candidatus Omnitrophota bacterium]
MIRSQRGATLIEVMIAVFIFLIGMASLLSVLIQSMQAGKRAEHIYTAYNLAKNHMERLKSMDYNSLGSAAESAVLIDGEGNPDANGLYSRSTTVTTSYSGNANLTLVAVSVQYTMQGVQGAASQIQNVIYNGG